jgi:hypothetical protein
LPTQVSFPEEDALVLAHPSGDKTFEFDRVFAPSSTQLAVFEDTEPLVTSVLDGYNVCIFAYGQVCTREQQNSCTPEANYRLYFSSHTNPVSMFKCPCSNRSLNALNPLIRLIIWQGLFSGT